MKRKIVMIVAHEQYQPQEYEIPKKLFQEAGFAVITASNHSGEAHATNNSSTSVDLTVKEINVLDYAALVFVGGPGALDHIDNDASYRKIQDAVMAGICVAGICAAARILAKAGALAAKKATGWDGDGQLHEVFEKHAVIRLPDEVVTDGRVITAVGPQVADTFAQAILKII